MSLLPCHFEYDDSANPHIQTGSVLRTFMLAMTLFPEAQKRAQEEIDRVVGCDRLPDFDDRENLRYIDAIYKECLRYTHRNQTS